MVAPTIGIPTAESGRALISPLDESATAGLYIDEAGSFVIPVTTDAVVNEHAAAAVTEAGFVAKKVEHSIAKLNSIKSYLDTLPATSSSTRSPTVCSSPSTPSSLIAPSSKTLRVQQERTMVPSSLSLSTAPFHLRRRRFRRCCDLLERWSLLTWSQRSGSLTAGHCGSVGTVFKRSSSTTSANRLGTITRQEVTTPLGFPAVVPPPVFTAALSLPLARVTYCEGTVRGLIRTTVCAEPGDSGGSLYASTTALGMTSGGSRRLHIWWCTYFQPANVVAT
ncbi:hypothetical protein BJ742DRAFT_867235 [Cladochytrium replicatum]|nr:hypothetical protein BJ742DRAFT_867235 [Cladochytrium replicatum]